MTKNKTIGILNRGKNNTFTNNSFNGPDIGICDEGEGTIASNNKFLHTTKNDGFWKKFWVHIVIGGLLVTIFGGVIVHLITR